MQFSIPTAPTNKFQKVKNFPVLVGKLFSSNTTVVRNVEGEWYFS